MTNIIETYVGSMTVGTFANTLGISVTTLIDLIGPFPGDEVSSEPSPKTSAKSKQGVRTAPKTTPTSSKTSKGKRVLGNTMNVKYRTELDDSIIAAMSDHNPIGAVELLGKLPWSNLSQDLLARALKRLGETGRISDDGNIGDRTYMLVKN